MTVTAVRRRAYTVSVLGFAACLAAAPARAQPVPIAWDVPHGCPSLADVASWLDAVVPEELRDRLDGITASVRITRTGRRFHAQIRVAHGTWSGDREVEGRRCEEVARSAVVVISVSLAEAVELEEAPPAPDPVPPITPEPVITPEPDPEVAPEPVVEQAPEVAPVTPSPLPAERLPRLLLGARAGLAFGVGTRAVAPTFALDARRPLHRNVALAITARVTPFGDVEDAIASARVTLALAGLGACARHAARAMLHLATCARVDVGALIAKGRDVESAQRGRAPYVAVTLAPAIEIGRRVRLRVGGELDARIVRPRLTVGGAGTIYRSPWVGGSLDLGVIFLIP